MVVSDDLSSATPSRRSMSSTSTGGGTVADRAVADGGVCSRVMASPLRIGWQNRLESVTSHERA